MFITFYSFMLITKNQKNINNLTAKEMLVLVIASFKADGF